MSAKRTLAEKLWTKVDPGPEDACWEWQGARSPTGHGVVAIGKSTTTSQRLCWTVHFGPIPEGLVVRHRCDNPPCCNPTHLGLGTRADNVRDAIERSEAWRTRKNSRALQGLDVEGIRARYTEGESQQSIADDLGISQRTVSRVVRRVGRFAD